MKSEKRKQQAREYYHRNKTSILANHKEKLKDENFRKEYCEKWRRYTRENYEARLLSSVKSKAKKIIFHST